MIPYAVATGFAIAIPEGYEVQVRPRSGLALKHAITCLNTPGTIDADYRGEEMTIAFNPAYLMEGVEAVSGDEVIIEVSDPSKAALLHGVDETKFRYLLMPVRVQ